MFRVSPWISYAPDGARSTDDTQPPARNSNREHGSDDDMDAPQISTLREEHSPPSTPAIQSEQPRLQNKFRVKLKLPSDPNATTPTTSSVSGASSANSAGGAKSGPGSNAGSGSSPASGATGAVPRPTHTIKVPGGRADTSILHSHASSAKTTVGMDSEEDDDEEQEEEEEDQLADDDDDPSVATSSVAGTPRRTASATRSRGGAVTRGRGGKGRGRGRTNAIAVSAAEPPQTIFELSPPGLREGHASTTISDAGVNARVEVSSASIKVPRKRGRKMDGEKEKRKVVKKSKSIAQVQDDAVSVTESLVGTQPSSPIMRDRDSPDMDTVPGGHRGGIDAQAAADGEGKPAAESTTQAPIHLDASVPIPVYRLPSKPFLVQAPPKIPSGFAQTVPLDRTHAPVRHWRLAQRAIRGIAGGQWLTRTWVGEKESAYATSTGRAGGDATGERDAAISSVTGPGAKGNRSANGISASISTGGAAPSPLSRSPVLVPTLRLPPSSTSQSLHTPPLSLAGKPPTGRSKLSTLAPLAAGESGDGSTVTSSHEGSPPVPVVGSLPREAEREGTNTAAPPVGQNPAGALGSRRPSKMRQSISAQDSDIGAVAEEDASMEAGAVPEGVDVDVVMDAI